MGVQLGLPLVLKSLLLVHDFFKIFWNLVVWRIDMIEENIRIPKSSALKGGFTLNKIYPSSDQKYPWAQNIWWCHNKQRHYLHAGINSKLFFNPQGFGTSHRRVQRYSAPTDCNRNWGCSAACTTLTKKKTQLCSACWNDHGVSMWFLFTNQSVDYILIAFKHFKHNYQVTHRSM